MFEKDQLRLELLKLTYKGHEHPNNAVASAKILEAYVTEGQDKEKTPEPVVKPQPAQSGKGKNNREHPYS